ncbi:hypothetical protein WA026_014684 [Henosepilachna vigintioctopunctata]|uniref:Rhythmically expressed gene 2 protein n=1 Tax=Henosepilachna vigintioctopunctata TaxID=420089 RepID=A0AAW1VFS1_9CUCU
MKNIFPFRLITFDVTNTLLNFKSEIGKAYGDVGAKHGVLCDPADLTKNFKRQLKKMSVENPNFGRDTGITWQEWWKKVVRDTFTGCQSDLSDSKLELICSELIDTYKTSTCWKPTAGSLDLLNYLKDRGVSLGVISNFDPRLHEILCATKLDNYFNFVLTSYEIGVSKPDEGIFKRAMADSKLELLKRDQCLHIGDTLELDYIGAKKYGWNSFLVLRNKPIDLKNSAGVDKEHVFKDLINLHEYLERKWNKYNVI